MPGAIRRPCESKVLTARPVLGERSGASVNGACARILSKLRVAIIAEGSIERQKTKTIDGGAGPQPSRTAAAGGSGGTREPGCTECHRGDARPGHSWNLHSHAGAHRGGRR